MLPLQPCLMPLNNTITTYEGELGLAGRLETLCDPADGGA
jgi:hypothetical protein